LIAGLILFGGVYGEDLPKDYEKWLEEEVLYVIAAPERKEFLSLTSDSQRDAFIEGFWRMRDPVPWTEENEFKQEHYRRIQYANERFHDGKPGWKTDRGKVHIIHGPPDETSFFFGGNRQRIMIRGATEVLTGGMGDSRGSYPVEFVRPQAEIWIYNRLDGATSSTSNFQIIFARVDPAQLHYLHQVIRNTADTLNPSYPARVQRDSAIMSFLRGRRLGGEHRIVYAGEYKFPDLDSFYESVFHPRQLPSFSLVDFQQAMRDLNRSSGDVLFERLERQRRLKELVQSRVSYSEFQLNVFCGSIRSDTGSTLLPITIGIDRSYAGDSLEVLLELIRTDGSTAASFVDEVRVGSEAIGIIGGSDLLYQTQLCARPGEYQLLVFGRLRDRESTVFLKRPVVLEDYSEDRLAVSDVLLFDRVITRTEYSSSKEDIDRRFLGGSKPLLLKDYVLVPAADAQFRRKDNLTVFFEVYNPSVKSETKLPDLELKCRLWKEDLPVGWMPATELDYLTGYRKDKTSALRTSYGVSIPLNTFDPGNYAFEVLVYDQISEQFVSNRTPFTVF
jgi:GWxTD domain-containing protein